MGLTIPGKVSTRASDLQPRPEDGETFAQIVAAQAKSKTPHPSTTFNQGFGATGNVSTSSSGFSTTIPLDPSTRLTIAGGIRANEGEINGAPVSNDVTTLTVGGSRTLTPSLTGNGSVTFEQVDNNVSGTETENLNVRLGTTSSIALSDSTKLTVSPSIGGTLSTPENQPSGVTIQPRLQVGVQAKVTPGLTLNGDVTAQVNIPGNDAAARRIEAAGNGTVVTVGAGASWQANDRTSLNLGMRYGVAGGGNPSSDPTGGPASLGAGEAAVFGSVNIKL